VGARRGRGRREQRAFRKTDMTVTLADLLKDSAYRLDQFKPEHIAALEASIAMKRRPEDPQHSMLPAR
ncbi:MAG: hypothetical protein ACK42S_17550, partial [Caldimonas sp.]